MQHTNWPAREHRVKPPPQQLIGIEQAGGPELPSEAILDHNCRAGDEVPEFTANDIRGIFGNFLSQSSMVNTRFRTAASLGLASVGFAVVISCAISAIHPARSGHSISPKKSHTLNSNHNWCCNATRRIDTRWTPARLIRTLPR